MKPNAMTVLEETFNHAKENDIPFVAVRVKMEGFPQDEVIINPHENIDSKLAYYKKVYDENLQHKFSPGIAIVDCTHGYNYDEIKRRFWS